MYVWGPEVDVNNHFHVGAGGKEMAPLFTTLAEAGVAGRPLGLRVSEFLGIWTLVLRLS